jgi:hypothetical protein
MQVQPRHYKPLYLDGYGTVLQPSELYLFGLLPGLLPPAISGQLGQHLQRAWIVISLKRVGVDPKLEGNSRAHVGYVDLWACPVNFTFSAFFFL